MEISVVPNQRAWYVNDVVLDMTGAYAAPGPGNATVGADGRFVVRVWPRTANFRPRSTSWRDGKEADPTGSGANDMVSFGT